MSWWADRSIFAKIATLLAFAFVAGIGLCGVDAVFLARLRDPGEEFGPNSVVGGIGAYALVLSAVGLVVTLFAWIVASVVGAFRDQDSDAQKLFDDRDNNHRPR
jgi:hypothetical protein